MKNPPAAIHLPRIPRSQICGVFICLLLLIPTAAYTADFTAVVPRGTSGWMDGKSADWSENNGTLHWRGLISGVRTMHLSRIHDQDEPGGTFYRSLRLPAGGMLIQSNLGEEWSDCGEFQPLLPASTEDEQFFRSHWPTEELQTVVVRDRLLIIGRNTSLRRPDVESGDGIVWTCDDGQTLIRVDRTQDWGEHLAVTTFAEQAWLIARGREGTRFFHSTWGNHWDELPTPPGPVWDGHGALVAHNDRLYRLDPSPDGRYASGFSTKDGRHWQAEPTYPLGPGQGNTELAALSYQGILYIFPHSPGAAGKRIRIQERHREIQTDLPWQNSLSISPFIHRDHIIVPYLDTLFVSRDGQDWPRLNIAGEKRLSGFLRCRVTPVADQLLPSVSWRESVWFFNRFPQSVDRFDLVHQPDPLPDRMVRSLIGYRLCPKGNPQSPGLHSGLRTIPDAPELSGGQDGVYCYQDLDADCLFHDDDFADMDEAEDEKGRERHPGLCLSASVRVGTDAEFDEACRKSPEDTEKISRNNRLAIIFEQFSRTGKRLQGRRNRFGFTVDLFGQVEKLSDDAACDSSAGVVTRSPVTRRSQDRRIQHAYRQGVAASTATPRGAELNRWTRGYSAAIPRFSDKDFSPDEDDQRYVIYIVPLKQEDEGVPRLTHAVDGLMLERAMEPAPYTEEKTIILGTDSERDTEGYIQTAPEPVNESIPYRSR